MQKQTILRGIIEWSSEWSHCGSFRSIIQWLLDVYFCINKWFTFVDAETNNSSRNHWMILRTESLQPLSEHHSMASRFIICIIKCFTFFVQKPTIHRGIIELCSEMDRNCSHRGIIRWLLEIYFCINKCFTFVNAETNNSTMNYRIMFRYEPQLLISEHHSMAPRCLFLH